MKVLKAWLAGVVLMWCATRVLALDYSNPELGFKVQLPDGLPDISDQVEVKNLMSRGRLDGTNQGPIEMILLQDLGAPIAREDLAKKAGKLKNATLEKALWKSLEIQVFRLSETVRSVPFVTFNAQVPLKPHAIQLTVAGPASDEARLRKELQTIVASVEGPSNWPTPGESARSPKQYLVAVALGVVVLVIGGIIALLVKRSGKASARPAEEAEPLPVSAVADFRPAPVLIAQCPMCQSALAPEQQSTARSCPSCGADLARFRR